MTPNPTLASLAGRADAFYVSKNSFGPSTGPVSIYVKYDLFPGNYSLVILNSAGEHIKTLDSRQLNQPFQQVYVWDGTNKYGETVASGMYVFYLTEPYSRKVKRILFVR
jgi:flagellar hook assembly protein FlgD